MLSLAGRGTLLIGARRIGAVVAARLAQENVSLAIAYRRSMHDAAELLDRLRPSLAKTALLQGDVTIEVDVKRIVSSAREQLGGLHFIVNLASDYSATPLASLDSEAWDEAMADAKAAYLLGVHGARAMALNRGPTRGHIILFGDWAAGETPYTHYLPYLASKAAVHFLGRGLAKELAGLGILVNTIAPGPTIRPPGITAQGWEANVIAKTPLNRESSAEDIAEMVVTLLKSETITGETIRVDAGRHLSGSGS